MITKQRINLVRVIVAALLLSLVQSNAYISQSGAVVVNDATSACPIDIVTGTSASVTVTVSGIYCVVEFKQSGSYTFSVPVGVQSVDYLVVGGGGGGASGGGGGGGVFIWK